MRRGGGLFGLIGVTCPAMRLRFGRNEDGGRANGFACRPYSRFAGAGAGTDLNRVNPSITCSSSDSR